MFPLLKLLLRQLGVAPELRPLHRGRSCVMQACKGSQGQALKENAGEDGRNIQSLLMKIDTAVGFYTALWGRHTGSSQAVADTLLGMEVGKA